VGAGGFGVGSAEEGLFSVTTGFNVGFGLGKAVDVALGEAVGLTLGAITGVVDTTSGSAMVAIVVAGTDVTAVCGSSICIGSISGDAEGTLVGTVVGSARIGGSLRSEFCSLDAPSEIVNVTWRLPTVTLKSGLVAEVRSTTIRSLSECAPTRMPDTCGSEGTENFSERRVLHPETSTTSRAGLSRKKAFAEISVGAVSFTAVVRLIF
jgi:hypothetical protein